MRVRLFFAGLVVLGALGAAAACSIDEGGTESDGSADVKTIEGGTDGPNDAPIDVPVSCQTLDATACAPTGLPGGWQWAVVSLTDVACPPGDYQPTAYVYSLGLEAGACTCGCATSGAWSCAGQIEAGTMPSCTGMPLVFDGGDDASCIDPGWNDPHIGIGPLPQPSGSPTCIAQEGGTSAYTAQTATSCTPGCTVDYCGVDAGGFSRCIVSPGSLTCPAPFTVGQPTMATSDKVQVACGACGCSVDSPGACSAAIYASNGDQCQSLVDASSATTTCDTPAANGFKVNSFLYVPKQPPVACTPDASAGTAKFTSTVTVCCLP